MDATPHYRLVRPRRVAVQAPILDDAQRAVVEHGRGPLLVVAGPGAGKTTTLVEAALARITAGVAVEELLLLTFSRRAAAELRERLTARLGRTIREPIARTIHSYAFGVLRLAALADGAPTPRLLAAAEQDVIIRELLAEGDPRRWPVELRPALHTEGFAGELRDLLMRAVERGYDGPALMALGEQRHRADWVAAGRFLTEYHGVTVLRDPGGYDPAELIRGALNALRDHPQLLADERARRRHIFVDEYQDTDPAQGELLTLLARGADELILVGDPDQSIYGFRGADESALREVDQRFGGAAPGGVVPVVALRTSRRCGPALLAATRRVAARLPGRAEHRELTAAGSDPGQAEVALFHTHSEEAAYVAGTLRRAYLDGVPWSRMAVLVRSTVRTLGGLRRAMISAGVPVNVRADDLPLIESPAVQMLLDLLIIATGDQPPEERTVEQLLSGPIGRADAIALRRLRRALRVLHPDSAGQLWSAIDEPAAGELLRSDVAAPVRRVARTLAAAREAVAAGGTAEDVLWAAWRTSGLAGRWERASAGTGLGATAANRDLDAVVALFGDAARFTDRLPGAPASQFVEHLQQQQIPADTFAGVRAEPEAVTILTAHASKGLEWDLVCVAGVQEGSWPDLRRRGTLLGTEELVDAAVGIDIPPAASLAPQLAEERRLFYVAVTRARRQLVVTAVADEDEQPSRFLDELDPLPDDVEARAYTPAIRGVHLSSLVAELRAVVTRPAPEPAEQRAAAGALAQLAAVGVRGAHPDQWWGLAGLSTTGPVVAPDQPVRVSPSRVEAFETCELQALLTGFGVSDTQWAASQLGSLIHAIAAERPEGATAEEYEQLLAAGWSGIDFGARWHADNERGRARAMLERLTRWIADDRAGLELVAVERDFELAVGDGPTAAILRGRVDRIERDAEGRLVIVDLKTGKSKPGRDDLLTHPQLGVYQLAVEQGGFPEAGITPGGGRLVQLGTGGPLEQAQPALGDADDPQWPADKVAHVAQRMHGNTFDAIIHDRCQLCDVRSSCPLRDEGGQVTS